MTKTNIIAEMAWAHDGSIEKAVKIMRAAKEAGADAIGIHITDLPEYMVLNYGHGAGRVSEGKGEEGIYHYLSNINPSPEDWGYFSQEARKTGINICIMPNDFSSLEFCEKSMEVSFYAISAASFVETDFVKALGSCNRRTLFRIGGATLGEMESAMNLFRSKSSAEIILLHGFQNYPTSLEETNIRALSSLREIFGVSVGLADHIDGGSSIAKSLPILALAFGATVIEKHITWNRTEKGEDFEAALNPSDFREFVDTVRAAEIALGNPHWGPLSVGAERYRSVSRKRIVAARDLSQGISVSPSDVAFKRSDEGISADKTEILIGRTLKTNLAKDEGITLEALL
jgi:sialic acid synthase SpsE